MSEDKTTKMPSPKPAECQVDGCDNSVTAKGYCSRHYQQFRAHGEIVHIEPGKRGRKRTRANSSCMTIHLEEMHRRAMDVIRVKLYAKTGVSYSNTEIIQRLLEAVQNDTVSFEKVFLAGNVERQIPESIRGSLDEEELAAILGEE